MDPLSLKLRAVIFDIYHTLLDVAPPPPALSARWAQLWRRLGKATPPLSLAEFDQHCHQTVAELHLAARSRGIAFSEVRWPEIARSASRELAPLPEGVLDDFLFDHARLSRKVSLMAGAAPVLTLLAGHLPLGLCSNCQPYTLRELDSSLASAGLTLELFESELCFFSFKAGFNKRNPAAFRLLEQTLAQQGIRPEQILMVGDRLDNDILPARAQGWQTWHLLAGSTERPGGDWFQLRRFLDTLWIPEAHTLGGRRTHF